MNSIFSIGNGQICVYFEGIDILQVFGPPLSAPSYMNVRLQHQPGLKVCTERENGSGIWMHLLTGKDGNTVGKISDFAVSGYPVFIRICELKQEIRFRLRCENGWQLVKNIERYENRHISEGFLAYGNAGISLYEQAHYPSIRDFAHQFLITGPARLEQDSTLILTAGKTVWYFVGGSSYPECILNTEKILRKRPEVLFKETQNAWETYLHSGKNFNNLLPENIPGRDKLLRVIEDVSVLIKSQQAAEGAVIAGHNFHMAYVRDQLGVGRGLLKMGFLEEAKGILKFYLDIFHKYGVIHNAQTIGESHYFHIHENDNVEITGYLIIQAFDYYEFSGDTELMALLVPMLEWAWKAQVTQLHENMLPFNGDETYVAGGILSRALLDDASAEATILFLAAGERFLPFMARNLYWTTTQYNQQFWVYMTVKNQFKTNFLINGRLIANRPYQKTLAKKRFARGVCTQCMTYGWVERNKDNLYVCCECYSRQEKTSLPQKIMQEIPSVQMMPLFIGTDLFSQEELIEMIRGIGRTPPVKKVLGYDAGILLINQIEADLPSVHSTYLQLLESTDKMGGWSEFYWKAVPQGTRYRPWESGINVAALIQYTEYWDK